MAHQPAPTYAARRRSPLPWILAALAVVLAALVAAVLLGRDRIPGWKIPATLGAAPATQTGAPTPGPTPRVADFKIKPTIVDKECFGSAGCNVTFRPDLSYAGPTPDPSDSWLLVYEILGVEDEPLVGNLTLTGPDYTGKEEFVRTASSKDKITVKVVSVHKD